MATSVDLSHYVTADGDGLARIELVVENVASAAAIGVVEQAVKAIAGMREARLNFTNHRLSAAWEPGRVDPAEIVAALDRAGHPAHPFRRADAEETEARHARWLMRCLAVAGFAAMNIMLLSVSVWSGNFTDITPETRDLFHWLSALIALPAAAYAGQPFFRSALNGLSERRMNMDVPISLGVLLALGMSVAETLLHATHAYFDSAVMLLFFLLCGRYLDHAMRRKTRAAAGNLAALKSDFALRIGPDGAPVAVPVGALAPGDRILVRPGDRIPADGRIADGVSLIDESLVTGETLRREAKAGELVHAGSLNETGALTLEVTAAGEGTLLDEVERLIGQASAARNAYVRLADRVSRSYSPVVHLTAAATATGWILAGASVHDAIVIAVAVLIITCPCALALAVPTVQVVASGALFRSGILLNSADAIERLAAADTIVFDKTGTLTLPEPRVANAAAIDPSLIALAARLALSSRHPLALAVAREMPSARPIPGASETSGQGVRAIVDGLETRLGSPSFCDVRVAETELPGGDSCIAVRHGEARALIIVRQALRRDAVETVAGLRAAGYRLAILSGDRPDAVAPVAHTLGIADWRGGCRPDDKIAALAALKEAGRCVLMVGDGLNDAPALAAADVSMSPIAAADVTQARADAVFLGERLAPVSEALQAARRARMLMRQNLGFSLLYNLLAVPLAMAGLVTPLVAAAAMSGSSVVVTLNALRARGRPAAPRQSDASCEASGEPAWT